MRVNSVVKFRRNTTRISGFSQCESTRSWNLGEIRCVSVRTRRVFASRFTERQPLVYLQQRWWKTDPTEYKDCIEEVAMAIKDKIEPEIGRIGEPTRPNATRLRRWVSALWVRGVRQSTLARQAEVLRERLALLAGDAMHVDAR